MLGKPMLRKLIVLGLASLAGSVAQANLITNGSFETGNLTGWTVGGTQLAYPPAVVITNGSTGCCFGEAVPADNIVGGSDDAAGTYGVYFVDDIANQTLSQSLFLAVGSYEIGFDAYGPQNGFNNYFDASFNGTIANVQLANYNVHDQSPLVWRHYSGVATIVAAGMYDVTFHYVTTGAPAADVVIDRAYILGTDKPGTTIVPEPMTLALLAAGLLGLVAMRRAWRTGQIQVSNM